MQPPENASPLRRAAAYLGLQRSVAAALAVVVLLEMGEKMAERFLPLYLLALGGGALSVGLLNGLDNLLSALYSFPGGYLSDRLGHKRALLLFNCAALAGYGVVIVFPYWQALIAGSVLFISWSAISLPATMTIVARFLPLGKRTMGVTMHSLSRRLPMALGPLVGGFLIDAYGEREGVRIAFAIAAALGVVAIVIQQVFIEEGEKKSGGRTGVRTAWRAMPGSLKRLLVSDILIRFCEQIPYAFVVVWVVKDAGLSASAFGVLTAIEMATAVIVYIPVAHFADRGGKKPFVLATFVFFTLFPVALWFSTGFGALVAAFVLRGLKEFGEPTRKALILDLAPEDMKGAAFGTYYLARDCVVSLAAFGGAFLWQVSPGLNFATAFAFGCLGTAYFAVFGRDEGR